MTAETLPFINPWAAVSVLLVIAMVFMLGLLVPRRAAIVQVTPSDSKLDAVFKRFDEFDHRFDLVEERLGHCEHDTKNIRTVLKTVPTKDVVHDIGERVSALTGQVGGMASGLLANTQSLGRIESFLMEAAADAIVRQRAALDAKADERGSE